MSLARCNKGKDKRAANSPLREGITNRKDKECVHVCVRISECIMHAKFPKSKTSYSYVTVAPLCDGVGQKNSDGRRPT